MYTPPILSANVAPCRTGMNRIFVTGVNATPVVVAGSSPRRWAVVIGGSIAGTLNINFGSQLATLPTATPAIGFQYTTANFPPPFTHEILGSAIHEDISVGSN